MGLVDVFGEEVLVEGRVVVAYCCEGEEHGCGVFAAEGGCELEVGIASDDEMQLLLFVDGEVVAMLPEGLCESEEVVDFLVGARLSCGKG